jgi:hypothetical protein
MIETKLVSKAVQVTVCVGDTPDGFHDLTPAEISEVLEQSGYMQKLVIWLASEAGKEAIEASEAKRKEVQQ